MRYRVGEDPATATHGVSDDMLLATVVLGLLIGILLTWAGIRGRQIWLATWCAGLVVASLAYLGWYAVSA